MQDDACQQGTAIGDNDNQSASPAKTATTNEDKIVTIDLHNISSRYRDICPLGCGSRGLVFSAVDKQCRRRLAVKKISIKSTTSPTELKRLIREIRILRRLDHDNVVRVSHTLVSQKGENGLSPNQTRDQHSGVPVDSVYIGMELMDTDLKSILKRKTLSPCYVKLFTYQLLRGLKYIHSANVIHRDLSPSNVFVNIDTLMLKIGDFGVSRIFDSNYKHTRLLSMAESTTSYQAPEILLHPHHYDKAIDVWAVGCIFAEMLSGKPIFTGKDVSEQLDQIVASVAVTPATWQSVVATACHDKDCCRFHKSIDARDNAGRPSFLLDEVVPNASNIGVNLLRQLLTFDPADRVTATDALIHPYLVPYGHPNDEPVCLCPFKLEDEMDDCTLSEYREILHDATSVTNSPPSSDHSEQPGDTSVEDGNCPSRSSTKNSLCPNDSCKNLLALVQSENHSNASSHSGAITMAESEARTMACDFDYGVQINDGSINRDRMCRDFQPISSNTCFDPYKWDSARRTETSSSAPKMPFTKVIDGSQDPGSDHGYHSSYCSSNLSHGNGKGCHPHSLWSLSSPDVSIDHERTGTGHRASTPDLLSPGIAESDDHSSDRHSPTTVSDARPGDHVDSNRRRHKDDLPRHHQSFSHHSSLYHHHHHHHHHKHHRHSNRHSSSQSQAANGAVRTSSGEADQNSSSGGSRCHQRRCVVTDTVPEVAEEGQTASAGAENADKVKSKKGYKSSSSDSDSNQRYTHNDLDPTERCKKESKPCRFAKKSNKGRLKSLTADSGFSEAVDEQNVDLPATTSSPSPSDVTTGRTRTWSDVGSAKKEGSFCSNILDGLLKKSSTSGSNPSILQRIRNFSGERGLDKSPKPPAKCSSPEAGRTHVPRKQLECPF